MQTALLPHLLKKDLRHTGLLFGLWFLLLLAQASLIGLGISAGPGDFIWQIVYTVLAVGIPLLQALVIIILLPVLVQDEPLVGDTAFWVTRPIARSTLLAEKLLFLFGFLILPPLVIEVIVFLVNGIALRSIPPALPEVLYGSLALIVPIAAIAVLTPSFARYALWLAISWVVMAIFGAVLQFGRMMLNAEAFLAAAQHPSLLFSQGLASGICAMAGGTLVVFHQYLTRRTRVSIIILIVTFAVSMALQAFWKIDFFQRPEWPASTEVFPPGSAAPSLRSNHTFISDAVQFSLTQDPKKDIRVELLFEHVPPGYQLELSEVDTTLAVPGQESITSHPSSPTMSIPERWWRSALSATVGVPVVNCQYDRESISAQLTSITLPLYNQIAKTPGTLRSTLSLSVRKLEVLGVLPLQKGSQWKSRTCQIEIATILNQTNGCRVILRERKLNLWSTGSFNRQFNPLGNDDVIYLLVNRRRNEAVLPEKSSDFNLASSFLRVNTRLINQSIPLEFTGMLRDKPLVQIDSAWLADAELVRLEGHPAGTLERQLTVENFIMNSEK